jgi:adenine-specific DNA-methyltransferase
LFTSFFNHLKQSFLMMILKELKPRKALNKAFLKVKPNRIEIEGFKRHLITLLERKNNTESEEYHKNLVSDFLKRAYYDPYHFINTKGRNDLVIHNGSKVTNSVGVILEVKKPTNKSEMVTNEKLNTKAFHELALYFLRERITYNNLELKHLVVTNINEWFIFDATLFDKLFAQDKHFVKQFTDFEGGRLAGTKTDFFYKQIAEPFINKMATEIEFTYFNLQDYQKPLRNNNKADDSKLIALFKLLSPEHLLKLPFANDSNSLDKRFYSELLHIIGLTEIRSGSRKLIERKKEGERNAGSILESAIIQLNSLDKISRLDRPEQFGSNHQERLFNVALELSITWINRILFLKLLEAQLITYHNSPQDFGKSNKSFSFLNLDKIKNYNDLNSLFFQVMACNHNERNEDLKREFEKIPYLNSSLFEPTELEHTTLFVSNLRDDMTLPVISSTVLKTDQGKKRTGYLKTLEYLFTFLNAYDFSSEGSEEIQEDNKALINASVLGLIFEKINGYKDGSFFTPGFITMFMCRETIRKAVIQKFNEAKNWNCKNLDDLYDKIEDRKEANEIVNSIKICDPAVGSGHFLVSALNEIIAVKNDLKILLDHEGRRLKEYHIEVVNDELSITDEEGGLFEYKPGSTGSPGVSESQRIQEALFLEKQTIIENCLFGVDINPNSVKICRLRLWIELLKNSYYTPESNFTELETLPNIDINIKCGNSLVSRFALDADLKQIARNSKWNIFSYQNAVESYKRNADKEVKRDLEKLIQNIKSNYVETIQKRNPKLQKYYRLKQEYEYKFPENGLFVHEPLEDYGGNAERIENEKRNLIAEIEKIQAELETEKSFYETHNAFEWRFEFPEVLNEDGDFLGFDVVIGNPPYIPLEAFEISERKFFTRKYKQMERKYETSVPFVLEGLNILNSDGMLSFIAPVTWQTGENYSKFRKYFFQNFGLDKLINLPFNIFKDAFVDTALYFISKKRKSDYSIYVFDKKAQVESLENLNYQKFNVADIKSPDYKINIDKSSHWFSAFNSELFVQFGSITKSTQGLSGSSFPETTGELSDFAFPFLAKGNVYNYTLIKEKVYTTDLSDKKNLIQFYQEEPKILIRRIISRKDRLSVTFCNEKLVFKKDINPFIPTDNSFDCLFLTGILASKLISFIYLNSSSIATKDDFRQTTLTELRKLPIPIVDAKRQKVLGKIVLSILNARKFNPNADTANLEKQIDQLVYNLYGLTEDEIAIVEHA